MEPVTVSTTVPRPVGEVYDHLDLLANHEAFTDHMLADWEVSGPASGVGAKARVRVTAPGGGHIDIEVVRAVPPSEITERSVGAGGKRVSEGTYRLQPLDGGATRVTFELRILRAPAHERAIAPLVRPWLRRGNQRALDRLAEQLGAQN
jgi:uncharacterized protein YndB with AHSA1/START domain